ncbi:MAG: polysaccharide deacetylase [Actinobacteria bacterium]|nr:MAG: polysaccharide deacetylase [Actinomycetota bacterium]
MPPEVIKYSAREGNNKVALTFDADLAPDSLRRVQAGTMPAQINTEVLDYLEQTGTPATVFVTGMWAQQYPEGMQRLAGNPLYEIGNHSWDHMSWTPGCYGLPTLPGNGAAEVTDTAEVIKSYTGKYPRFFRFPGLCHDDEDVAIVAANGERVVDTDISGSDAFAKDGYAVASSIASQAQAGSIIVLHLNGAPNAGTTATIVQNLVPALKAQGLQPVTLSQMLG